MVYVYCTGPVRAYIHLFIITSIENYTVIFTTLDYFDIPQSYPSNISKNYPNGQIFTGNNGVISTYSKIFYIL